MDCPEEREVGMVFQDGALFPHLSVAQNIAYGLRPRPAGRRARANGWPRSSSDSLSRRWPRRSRAAFRAGNGSASRSPARWLPLPACSCSTSLFRRLMPRRRPASPRSCPAHSAGLRLPTILVSHDLEDVAGLAERVAVMDAGQDRRDGDDLRPAPGPASGFVAAFVGANYFVGWATRVGRLTRIDLGGGGHIMSEVETAGRVGVVVQPWHVSRAAGGLLPGCQHPDRRRDQHRAPRQPAPRVGLELATDRGRRACPGGVGQQSRGGRCRGGEVAARPHRACAGGREHLDGLTAKALAPPVPRTPYCPTDAVFLGTRSTCRRRRTRLDCGCFSPSLGFLRACGVYGAETGRVQRETAVSPSAERRARLAGPFRVDRALSWAPHAASACCGTTGAGPRRSASGTASRKPSLGVARSGN